MTLANKLGVECSRRCELLLAYTYEKSPERVVSVARHLGSDANNSAMKLAIALSELPTELAKELVGETLGRKSSFSVIQETAAKVGNNLKKFVIGE